MAMTVSYSLNLISNQQLPYAIDYSGDSDVVGLSTGGYAGVGVYASNPDFSAITIYDAAGNALPTHLIAGNEAKLTQLTNGNIVATATSADYFGSTMNYLIQTPGDSQVSVGTIGSAGETVADVAALAGGGFVVASNKYYSGLDYDVFLHVRDAAGNDVTDFKIDGSAATDLFPSVAGLNDGGFAVAWERSTLHTSPNSNSYYTDATWVAVYNADGSVRSAAREFDHQGSENGQVNVSALKTGGFSVAYTDNGWSNSAQNDITLATFDSSGAFKNWTRAASLAADDHDPSATTLSNGMVLTTFTDGTTTNYTNNSHTYGTLIDPATGTALNDVTNPFNLANNPNMSQSSVSALDHGRFVVSHEDASNAVWNTEYQLVRTVFGDSAKDKFVGDDAADYVNTEGGNDTLNGGGNADSLTGGAGADKFVFDAIADAKAAAPLYDTINDYDQGNSGVVSAGEGDQIDLSALLSTAYNHGNGQPVDSLVRAVSHLYDTGASLMIDTDGAANGQHWVTIAYLDDIHGGDSVNVILDASLTAGSTILTISGWFIQG
jgi:hypothetical protein